MSQEELSKKSGNHAFNGSEQIESRDMNDQSASKSQRIKECMDNLLVLNKIQGSLLSQMNKEIG